MDDRTTFKPDTEPARAHATEEQRKNPRLARQRGMIQLLHDTVHRVTRAKPGERFIRHYERQQRQEYEHPLKSALYFLLGIILILTGLAFGFLPILPGFLFGIPGVVIIASRSRTVAVLLDRAELAIRRTLRRFRARLRSKNVESSSDRS